MKVAFPSVASPGSDGVARDQWLLKVAISCPGDGAYRDTVVQSCVVYAHLSTTLTSKKRCWLVSWKQKLTSDSPSVQ